MPADQTKLSSAMGSRPPIIPLSHPYLKCHLKTQCQCPPCFSFTSVHDFIECSQFIFNAFILCSFNFFCTFVLATLFYWFSIPSSCFPYLHVLLKPTILKQTPFSTTHQHLVHMDGLALQGTAFVKIHTSLISPIRNKVHRYFSYKT